MIANAHGAEAQMNADAYAGVYNAERGAMIVYVIASRQRTYRMRVKRIVADWKAANEQHSMHWLADHPIDAAEFGLSAAEAVMIQKVATNLRAFTVNEGQLGPEGEDTACTITHGDVVRCCIGP
jgi:hypothetical protein